jgi:hypothetical protein
MCIREMLGNLHILLFIQMLARGQCASGRSSDQPSQHRLRGFLGFAVFKQMLRLFPSFKKLWRAPHSAFPI